MIEAALFDFDGTLVDSERVKFIGWREALLSFGYILSEELFSSLVGEPRKAYLETFEKVFGVDPGELFRRRKEAEERILRDGRLEIMPYAREALEFFIKKDIPVGVVTQSEKKEVLCKLGIVGLDDLELPLICAEDVKKQKPDPEGYILAAERSGVSTEKCISFEDSGAGVKAAKGAGVIAVAVPNRYTQWQDFSGADFRFDNLEEAINCVRSNYF